MKTPAEVAIDNVLVFDVKKDGLQQKQNGDWVLRLTIAQLDMHQVIVNAMMGTIFQCTLVEKNDDGTAVDHQAMVRDKWRALRVSAQAGIRCGDPVFWAWLEEEKKFVANNNDEAATAVRELCGVVSRADLDKPGFAEARIKWHDLDYAFQAWKARESA